jgi:hypothetical protein
VARAADPAKRFRRSAWPDVIIVLAVLALGATGAVALWGDDLLHRDGGQRDLPVEQAPPSAGGT